MTSNWIVSQLGARQHYAVPRGFHHEGRLGRLYTDAWVRHGHGFLTRGPHLLRALSNRYHADLPAAKVVSFNGRTLWGEVRRRSEATGSLDRQAREWVRTGKWFASAVAADLARRPLDPATDVFFGFDTACLETLRLANDRGIVSVCDQVDPARVEADLVAAEAERWPGWQARATDRIPEFYWERLAAEWAAASIVLVNSTWSKSALISQGVPASKIVVLPPPFQPALRDLSRPVPRRDDDAPLTVLWLGTVNLRKGIQYLIDAARRLAGNPRVEFVVAGPIHISPQAVATATSNVRFVGPLTRDRTAAWYRLADLFVLPTLSDGFALTQLEAMSQGLPVIATPNCGRVVTPGVDGLIVPASDGEALAAAIASLDADRPRLREMSFRALDKSTQFFLPKQARQLDAVVADYRAARASGDAGNVGPGDGVEPLGTPARPGTATPSSARRFRDPPEPALCVDREGASDADRR